MTPEKAFEQALDFFAKGGHGRVLGVAVSGGGDSMALLNLADNHARRHGYSVTAATVDHGLRVEAADEAAAVAAFCTGRGIPHQTLKWQSTDLSGNVSAAAREGRYGLLSDWSATQEISVVLLGHTRDDQAETVLMNLARGSGVDGLSGIDDMRDGLFLRPLLSVSRDALRQYLGKHGIKWIDDPSNDDLRFDRVKARRMMGHLAELGLTADRLIQTASHMQRARHSLWHGAAELARTHVTAEGGDLILTAPLLNLERSDTEGRVAAAAIQWVGARDYRPRYKALQDAMAAVRAGETRTLGGVILSPEDGGARLIREVAATESPLNPQPGMIAAFWDRRWQVSFETNSMLPPTPRQFPEGITIRALNEGITHVPDWRETGLSRRSLMATPAIYDGETLLAAPVAGFCNGWSARIVADFASYLAGH